MASGTPLSPLRLRPTQPTQPAAEQPSDLASFTQQLLLEMRGRMQVASERVAARLAAAAAQVDELERALLALVEPPRRRPSGQQQQQY